MKIDKMDNLLIEINSLKNIRSIKYNDLYLTMNNKISILPSIIVFYDNMKCINLCINDKYFYELLRKVKEIYLEEKEKETKDIYGKSFYSSLNLKIEIDPLTKLMLEESNLDELIKSYSFYDKDKSYNESLLFTTDEINTLLPIVKYNIKETLKQFDKTIVFNEKYDGYRNKLSFNTSLDGLFHPLLVDFNKKSFNNYEFIINNLFDNIKRLKIDIEFKNDGIVIKNIIDEILYENKYEYQIKDNEVVEVHTTHINNELTLYSENVLEKKDNKYKNITDFNISEEMNWYKLPWNSLFGYKKESTKISEIEEIEYIHNNYFSLYDNGFISRDSISKVYKKNIKAYDLLKVELERIDRVNTGINKDNEFWIIESKFNKNGTNGYYKNYLADKYYYYTCKYEELESININELITLDKETYEVFDKTDLLRKNKMLTIIKGVGE